MRGVGRCLRAPFHASLPPSPSLPPSTPTPLTPTPTPPQLRLLYTVQSHRPLTLNIEDYLRVCAVPKRAPYECGDDERANRLYYNFRDMPGVVNGEGKSVCVGHW